MAGKVMVDFCEPLASDPQSMDDYVWIDGDCWDERGELIELVGDIADECEKGMNENNRTAVHLVRMGELYTKVADITGMTAREVKKCWLLYLQEFQKRMIQMGMHVPLQEIDSCLRKHARALRQRWEYEESWVKSREQARTRAESQRQIVKEILSYLIRDENIVNRFLSNKMTLDEVEIHIGEEISPEIRSFIESLQIQEGGENNDSNNSN